LGYSELGRAIAQLKEFTVALVKARRASGIRVKVRYIDHHGSMCDERDTLILGSRVVGALCMVLLCCHGQPSPLIH
jgi:hypothetical protein